MYATALARFLEERSALAVTESLNAVYSVVPSTMDEAMMRAQMEVLAREAW